MLRVGYDYNYFITNVVTTFCNVLGLFVICSKKRFCFLELWVKFIEAFAGIKSSLFFFKKRDWDRFISRPAFVVFGILYTENYHSRKSDTTFLIYFISTDCSVFFLSRAFLGAIFILQLVPSRHKDVAKTSQKRLSFGLKDVLDWSEMEVATTFI